MSRPVKITNMSAYCRTCEKWSDTTIKVQKNYNEVLSGICNSCNEEIIRLWKNARTYPPDKCQICKKSICGNSCYHKTHEVCRAIQELEGHL